MSADPVKTVILDTFRNHGGYFPNDARVAEIKRRWLQAREDTPPDFRGPEDGRCRCCHRAKYDDGWMACYDCRHLAIVTICAKDFSPKAEVVEESWFHKA